MTARERVIEAERRVREVAAGKLPQLCCPFCESISTPGNVLCCMKMAIVVDVVLDHLEFKDMEAKLEQILDTASVN